MEGAPLNRKTFIAGSIPAVASETDSSGEIRGGAQRSIRPLSRVLIHARVETSITAEV